MSKALKTIHAAVQLTNMKTKNIHHRLFMIEKKTTDNNLHSKAVFRKSRVSHHMMEHQAAI